MPHFLRMTSSPIHFLFDAGVCACVCILDYYNKPPYTVFMLTEHSIAVYRGK